MRAWEPSERTCAPTSGFRMFAPTSIFLKAALRPIVLISYFARTMEETSVKSVGDIDREETLRVCDGVLVVKALPVMARAQKMARMNLIGDIVKLFENICIESGKLGEAAVFAGI